MLLLLLFFLTESDVSVWNFVSFIFETLRVVQTQNQQ